MYLKKIYQIEKCESILYHQYCQRTINIIICSQEVASLITKQRSSKGKDVYLFLHQGHANKPDSEHLENYVQIYAYAYD